jgi:hypothetical protein
MRDTTARAWVRAGWFGRNWSDLPVHALRIGAVALSIGFVMMSDAARAQDDDNDDRTFEEKIIDGLMAGVGATNMTNQNSIDYRERSPLVVPPTTELRPPASTSAEVKVPNWPKDPDVARRKALIERRKNEKKNSSPEEDARILKPSELAVGKTAPTKRADNDPVQPGVTNSPMLSPSQLGFNGSFSNLFHGNTSESVPFKEEPTRDSLTQPPPGYQTPSSNFAYGTGPKESLNKPYNPAAGQYGDTQ